MTGQGVQQQPAARVGPGSAEHGADAAQRERAPLAAHGDACGALEVGRQSRQVNRDPLPPQ